MGSNEAQDYNSFQRNPHLLTSIALLVQHMHVVSTFNGDVSILRLEFNFEMSFVWWHFCKFWYQIQITEGWMVKTKNTSMPLLTCSRKKHSIKTIHMTSLAMWTMIVEKNIQTRHYINGLAIVVGQAKRTYTNYDLPKKSIFGSGPCKVAFEPGTRFEPAVRLFVVLISL